MRRGERTKTNTLPVVKTEQQSGTMASKLRHTRFSRVTLQRKRGEILAKGGGTQPRAGPFTAQGRRKKGDTKTMKLESEGRKAIRKKKLPRQEGCGNEYRGCLSGPGGD